MCLMNDLRKILEGTEPGTVLRGLDLSGDLRALEPSLADLRMDMPAGVHHKDNLVHSIRVLELAVEGETDGPDIVLRTAALFHDIGKPRTRRFGGHKSVTFDGHEVVGAALVRRILPRHGYNRSEVDEIAELVRLHMRSHGFEENGSWTDSAVRRLMHDVSSDDQMRRLVVIFRSDCTTRHHNVRSRILRHIDTLEEEMDRVRSEDERKAARPALNGHDVMNLLGMEPGRALGRVMRFLNSDEGVVLSREEAEREIRQRFGM